MLETGVRELRIVKRECLQIGMAAQLLNTGVGDIRVAQIEPSQLRETAQVLEASVCHLCVIER